MGPTLSFQIQHFAYLQDINRNHPKSTAAASELTGKLHAAHQQKKASKSGRAHISPSQYRGNAEEAEQRYAVAIQPPNPTSAQAPHYAAPPTQIVPRYQQLGPQQEQPGANGSQQPYQIIPEEEFLKLLEDELRARAFHEAQYRQQQAAHAPSPNKAPPLPLPTERVGQGLGSYRQHPPSQPQSPVEEPIPEYVQYVPRQRGGPKYLPQLQPQPQPQPQQGDPHAVDPSANLPPPPHIPPQLAYYQPQVSYKTLPNHPLAKSSLENEIEKLLAANKPSPNQLVDNSNEPSGVVHQQQQAPQQQMQPHPVSRPRPYALQQKIYSSQSGSQPTPTPLVDANNQPFIPSLFRFSNIQQSTPIYPTQVPQHIVDSKKLGPVVYPPTQSPATVQQPQPTQYFYQELNPTTRPKARSKHYGSKVSTSSPKLREKEPPNYPNVPAAAKYINPHLYYDYERQLNPQAPSRRFHPSPPDPNTPSGEQQTQAQPRPQPLIHAQYSAAALPPQKVHTNRQYISPSPAPSQSSIYVSQGTGIATPSHNTAVKTKSIEDVRQLHLPQPGGKPLTQTEFQALIDAGYPVTAVPVPVPVPYEQYIKEHPEFRNQPVDYAQLMQHIAQQYGPRRGLQAQASESTANAISSSADEQTAMTVGGGNITYLRPIADQKRHPRDEKETSITGKADEAKQ